MAEPLVKLAEIVSETQAFQERAGLTYQDGNASEKLIYGRFSEKQRIFLPSAPCQLQDLLDLMPVAVIQRAQFHATTRAGGQQNYVRPFGQLRLILADVDRMGGIVPSMIDFDNFAGQVASQAYALFAKDDRLDASGIHEWPDGSKLCSETEQFSRGQFYWMTEFLIDWGQPG